MVLYIPKVGLRVQTMSKESAFYQSALSARRIVESWPKWKQGDALERAAEVRRAVRSYKAKKQKEEKDKAFELEARGRAARLNVSLSSVIMNEMDAQGVNRNQLAKRTGLSRSHITQILDGDCNPSLLTLGKIEVALGIYFKIGLHE